ncbi:hypothetical protein T439DRAFT_322160 [Meredithblackwellia eburnea MCA 4105]
MKGPRPRFQLGPPKLCSSSASQTAKLVPFYHQTATFHPLNPSQQQQSQHLTSILTDRSRSALPNPVPISILSKNAMLVHQDARTYGIALDGAPRQSLNTTQVDRYLAMSSDVTIVPNDKARHRDDPVHTVFQYGTEPLLKKRVRTVVDALCGTVCGGKPASEGGFEAVREWVEEMRSEATLARKVRERAAVENGTAARAWRESEGDFENQFEEEKR